jgi:hypothetical protein
MAALCAGGDLMHAFDEERRITVHLNGAVSGLERIESQAARADRGNEHCLRRAHATIVDADKVVGVEPSERRCVCVDERHAE